MRQTHKEYMEEYVPINGIQHYLLHYPKNPDAPVLLYIHGGPGSIEHCFAHTLNKAWGDLFTQVHWDQRGAGRTLIKNGKDGFPKSVKQMMSDLHGVVTYLKRHYQTDKIVLLGHSWGSLLGSLYALHCPRNVSAYIGSGQVINIFENERIGFLNAMNAAKEAGNQKHIAKLEKIGDYPPEDVRLLLKLISKVRAVQSAYEPDSGSGFMLKNMLTSPHFNPKDFASFLLMFKSNRTLLYRVFKFDIYKYSQQYQVPVYYILGEHDTVTPIELSTKYFDTIEAPIKSLTMISDAGHNPMYEQPDAFANALKAVRSDLDISKE